MSACIILAIGLLCSTVSCADFKWDPLLTLPGDKYMEEVAHDTSADGSIHMVWEKADRDPSLLMYQVFLPNRTLVTKAAIKGIFKKDRFHQISVRVSADAKHVLVAYVGRDKYGNCEGDLSNPCPKVYFIESLNGGETWTAPIRLDSYRTKKEKHHNPSITLEEGIKRVYISYVSSYDYLGKEKYMPCLAVREPGSAFFVRKELAKLPYDSAHATIGCTIDEKYARHYLHYLMQAETASSGKALYHARSDDKGKNMSSFTLLERKADSYFPNVLAVNNEMAEGGVYVMFNNADDKGRVRKGVHGKRFMRAMRPNGSFKKDSKLTFCSRDGKGILLAAHYKYSGSQLFASYLPLNTRSFQSLPYAFEGTGHSSLEYIGVSCSVVGYSKYSITLLAKGPSLPAIHAAHGILSLD